MTLARPSLDYTAKDFDAIRARLFNIIPSAFPEWTDVQVANFGNILVELFAWVGDVLTFYQDNQAQESRWSSALLRRSILSMIKMVGYTPTGNRAARAVLTVRLNAPPTGSVPINIGDLFSTLDAANLVEFQALETIVIPAGANPPVGFVTVEHSKPFSENYISSGLPNQSFLLAGAPYLAGSLAITGVDGEWTLVDDLLSSTAQNRHFILTTDSNLRAKVTFGDGIAGSVPTGSLLVAYKTGGGVTGNVGVGAIQKAQRTYYDSLNNPVVLRVSNVSKAEGGIDVQTIESIRESVPRSIRTNSRTVAREDYEINALKVPGVARALMLTRDEQAAVPENTGRLYVVPIGGGTATAELMTAVMVMITDKYPKTITFRPYVLSALYHKVKVSTVVHLAKGAVPAVVGVAVRTAIADFFALLAADGSMNTLMDFGYYLDGSIAWSDVFNVVRDVRGVRKVDDGADNVTLNGQADDLVVPPEKFPTLESVTVIDAASGQAI